MKRNLKWYRLDTSAKIYPALESIRNPALFRVSISLDEDVNPDILLKVLNSVKDRFPYYNVHMKKGLFWNYLEQNKSSLRVWKDAVSPCQRIYPIFNHGYLYKIMYYRNKISLDIFHVLTDGTGAIEFLKCIVNQYLLERGLIDTTEEGIIDASKNPSEEEEQDGFVQLLYAYKDDIPKEKKRTLISNKHNFIIKDKHLPPGKYKVVTGIVQIDEIKILSKKYNATITQLLTALYMDTLIAEQKKQNKKRDKVRNIAIQIPVNMRKYYDVKCMRNFSLFVIPEVNPKKAKGLKDIIEAVKQFMSEHLTMEHLLTMADDNSVLASNPFIKYTPVGLKNIIIRFFANTKGSTQFSGTISNLGLIKLPQNVSKHVKDVEFVLGPSNHNKCSCAVAGYDGKLYITFGRSVNDAIVSRGMFGRLVEMGVGVEVRSNY